MTECYIGDVSSYPIASGVVGWLGF